MKFMEQGGCRVQSHEANRAETEQGTGGALQALPQLELKLLRKQHECALAL